MNTPAPAAVTDTATPAAGSPVTPATPPPRPRRYFPWGRVLVWSFVGFVVLGFFVSLLPLGNSTCIKGPQTMALARAKQIGLALRLYAGDHDGAYPTGTNPDTGEPIRNANDAFRCLFPRYLTSEAIFANKLSAYQILPVPGNDPHPGPVLRPGVNVYAYTSGLTDGHNPAAPLVADGTDGTGRGTYTTDSHARGGLWGGNKAVVIRLDNSGALENLIGPPDARYVKYAFPDASVGNLLSPAALATLQLKPDAPLQLLDPAVAALAKAGKGR